MTASNMPHAAGLAGLRRNEIHVFAGAAAIFVFGVLGIKLVRLEPLTMHMAWHIALMNIAAPLAAIAFARITQARKFSTSVGFLWLITIAQTAVLIGWHAPALQRALVDSGALPFLMHASLLIAALLFWFVLLRADLRLRWHGIAALLVTGKFACLLAALLVFAPAVIYSHETHHGGVIKIEDQQMAGLLMIAACPLSYVLAAIVLAAQALQNPIAIRRGRKVDRAQ